MARQQPKPERDGSTVVRNVIRRARDSTPADGKPPVKIPVDIGERGSTHVLPNGTRLAEFEIVGLVGEGGFGIVYLAYDHSLARHVAIKEYMPSGMATRTRTLHVSVRSKDQAAVFKAGLRSFVNEARLLAQFDSPSLVKVFRFWEGNNTAYMVMPFYEGITLKNAYKEHQIVPTEEWIKIFLVNLCDALEMIHQARCYHRDIAPDNILVLPEGQPLLLDFGAARQVINERTQGPTAVLKPGFAPIEQYANIADLKQGPWTDVYALAAVVYYLITGKAPLPAVARYVKDEMVSAREAGRKRYSAGFLGAIDRALAVRPDQRLQSIAALRGALGIDGEVHRTMPPASVPDAPELTQRADPTQWPAPMPASASASIPAPAPASDATQTLAATHMLDAAAQASTPRPEFDTAKTQRIEPHFTPIDPPAAPSSPARASLAARFQPLRTRVAALVLVLIAAIGAGITYRALQGTPGEQAVADAALSTPAPEEPFRPIGRPGAVEPAPATVPAVRSPDLAQAPAPASTMPKAPLPAEASDGSGTTPPVPSDATLWKAAITARTASAYQAYLEQYPKGRHARQAAERLAKLHPERTTEPVASSTDATAPPAPDPNAAERKGTGKNATTVSPESASWSQANLADTRPGYEAYLSAYPDGAHARTARNRLEVLKQSAQPAAQPASAAATASVSPTVPSASAGDANPIATAPAAVPAPPVPAAERAATETPPLAGARAGEPAAPVSKAVQREPAAPAPKPAPLAAQAREPDAGAPRLGNTIRVAGQTFTGNFAVDPMTGIVSGSGRVTWSNGDRFDGTMVNGIKQGQGEFVWANGQRYKGTWARDLPNGSGVLHFSNGNDYVGQVKDGMPNGKGSLKYADGAKYQGGFSNGLPDGVGISAFKNGDAYDGHWLKGKSNGHGKYTWANGDTWEGEFRNDQRTADGKMVFAGSAAATPDAASDTSTRDAAGGR